MKISKALQNFANRLQHWYHISNKVVLTHPEKYLGSNSGEVINFWLYLDTLTEDQLIVVKKRYLALNNKKRDEALTVARNTIKYVYEATEAAFDSVSYANFAADYATGELIDLDKLLDQGYQPVFLPLFLNL
jgi:hypothetical protein